MRFPGKRKTKHYFPVSDRGPESLHEEGEQRHLYIVGVDQLLVDIEAEVTDEELAALGIPKGGSQVLDTALVDHLYADLKERGRIVGEYAGGSVGNTLHNYSVLADDLSYLIGSINRTISIGDYAFHYIRNTSSRVNLAHLQPVDGPMGRAFCFVTSDRERSFGISRGIMDELSPDTIPAEVIAGAEALVLTAYLLRDPTAPIHAATRRAIDLANEHKVPVVLSLGTEWLVREQREALVELLKSIKVSILAGNFGEVCALTGEDDPLLASRAALQWCDMVLLTRDKHGLYLAGWTDPQYLRETRDPVLSKSIAEYNRYEYSRAMPRWACHDPVPVFSHINPYHGGPSRIHNTNGAGDAALGAVLHDLVANAYHRAVAPNSPKHATQFLTYSSIHQVCKYANRVSYEVLRNHCPRLLHGLPEREDSLEEAYWVQ